MSQSSLKWKCSPIVVDALLFNFQPLNIIFMTFNETLNQFLILGAALCKHAPSNDLELSQQCIVRDEILYNIEFATQIKNLFENNFIFEGKQGCVPTVKGWKSIQPKVSKPFNRTRIPQEELVLMTISLLDEICYRKQNHPKFQSIWKENSSKLDDSFNCVFKEENNLLANEMIDGIKALGSVPKTVISDVVSNLIPQEVETSVEEVKVVTKTKKAKKAKKEVVA